MATFRGLMPELLEPNGAALKFIFFQEFAQIPLRYPDVFNTVSVKTAFIDDIRVAGLGRFVQKPEGTPAAFSDPVQGDRRRTVVLTFALGFRVTMEMREDEQYGIVAKMPSDLAQAARDSQDRLAWAHYNVQFTAADDTAPCGPPEGDGTRRPLFDTGHVPMRNAAATLSNRLNPGVALSTAGMEAALQIFYGQQSEEERYINVTPNALVIHQSNTFVADQLLESEKEVGTAENQINTVSRNRIGVRKVVVPYITDEDSWALFDTTKGPLDWVNRKSLTGPQMSTDSQSFDSIYISHYRANVRTNANWAAAVGSAP
jgi:hypothetical protein